MKKIIGIAIIAVAAITAGWNYLQNKNNQIVNDLILANIEALANPEMADGKEFYEKTGCYLNCSPSSTCIDKFGKQQNAADEYKCSCGGHEY